MFLSISPHTFIRYIYRSVSFLVSYFMFCVGRIPILNLFFKLGITSLWSESICTSSGLQFVTFEHDLCLLLYGRLGYVSLHFLYAFFCSKKGFRSLSSVTISTYVNKTIWPNFAYPFCLSEIRAVFGFQVFQRLSDSLLFLRSIIFLISFRFKLEASNFILTFTEHQTSRPTKTNINRHLRWNQKFKSC